MPYFFPQRPLRKRPRAAAALVATSGVFFLAVSALAAPEGELARPADDFVDSIGLNGVGGPYVFRYNGERQKLYKTNPVAPEYILGVRHARYEIRPGMDLEPFIDLADEQGIRINALISWLWTDPAINKSARIADALEMLAKLPPGSVATIEGNNESDMPFESGDFPRYASSTEAAQANQAVLYRAVKADARFSNVPVIAWTLGKNWPWGGNAGYGKFVSTDFDYESLHSYPAGDSINGSLTAPGHNEWLKVAASIRPPGAPAKPIVVTETGFTRIVVGPDKVEHNSEWAQARQITMLLAENFSHGFVRTFFYSVGGERGWSVDTRDDGSQLPAGLALSYLTSTLGEAHWDRDSRAWIKPTFQPGKLPFTLSHTPGSVHHLLLQRSDRTFYLLLWNDVVLWDGKNFKDIQNPSEEVTIRFGGPISHADISVMNTDGSYSAHFAEFQGSAENPTLAVHVPDSVLLIHLTLPHQ